MRKSAFRQAAVRFVEIVTGPEPIGAAMMNKLQGYNQRALSGLETRPYFGIQGDASTTFSGPVPIPPQGFVGGVQMGAQGRSIPVDQAIALPNEVVPSSLPDVPQVQWGDYTDWDGQ